MTGMRLATFRRGFEKFLEWTVLVLMMALAMVVIVGVGFRKAGAALVWYDEVASILLAWLTYYAASLAALHRAHIGFPKFVEAMRLPVRRALVVFREVVVVGFFLVVAWAGFRVLQILGGTYLVGLPSVPARVSQSVIPIGALLFIMAELLSFADIWPALKAPHERESP